MSGVDIFLEHLSRHGLEFYRSFYSEYRGIVKRNDDPEGRGRIQAHVPQLADSAPNIWIDPSFPGTGPDRGVFWPPELEDVVWVRYERGRPDSPICYIGGWHGKADTPSPQFGYTTIGRTKYPERRGLVTRMGHTVVFDDTKDEEAITLTWHHSDPGDQAHTDRWRSADRSIGETATLRFDNNGAILINKIGATIHLDSENKQVKILCPQENGGNASQITMDDSGIKVIDDSGKNMILIDNGTVKIYTEGEITFNAPLFTSDTGGTNLSHGASESVVLGDSYTTARAQMHSKLAIAVSALGTAAQILVPFLSPPQNAGIATPKALAEILLPFFQAVAPLFLQAGIGVTAFEAANITYLSKVTKTA